MYALVRSLQPKELLLAQAPALMASLVIAELLYKFHSFTLEAMAFLLTWGAIDAAVSAVRGLLRKRVDL